MNNKYFVCSFDDGLEQDRRIVQTLKEFGMGGTFHLNSGLLGAPGYTVRIGNLGLDAPKNFDPGRRHLLPFVGHSRIPENELLSVYKGFEIAAHTVSHPQLVFTSRRKIEHQIADDVKTLSALFDQEITGFAYPFGFGSRGCRRVLQDAGIRYARIASKAKDFRFPRDPLSLHISAMCISRDAMERVERFIEADATEADLFFLFFAHGYELDFGTRESNWEKFRSICSKVKSAKDIICCSIGDAFRMHEGQKPLFYPYSQD